MKDHARRTMQPENQNRVSVWLTRHSPLRLYKPNNNIYVGPIVVDFLNHDVFEDALIHLCNELGSICILE